MHDKNSSVDEFDAAKQLKQKLAIELAMKSAKMSTKAHRKMQVPDSALGQTRTRITSQRSSVFG